MKIKGYLEGFSGYCGFRKGLEEAGFEFENHYFSEIDKYAIANTRYNYPDAKYVGSIENVRDHLTEPIELFTFGWPCQDNSIAGKRKGQRPDTRSGLLFHAVEILRHFKPRNFIAENVEGLRTVNKGIDIIESLKILAFLNDKCPQYDIEMQLLNTRWFLPQNRERLFFVGHLRGSGSRKVLPIGESISGVNERAEQAANIRCLTAGGNSGGLHSSMTLVHSLQRRQGKGKGGKGHLSKVDSAIYCLDTVNMQAIETDKIRRLTPVEFERFQGLPDNWTKYGIFEKKVLLNKKEKSYQILNGINEIFNTQRYKLCGNGVSIPVIKEIGLKLINSLTPS